MGASHPHLTTVPRHNNSLTTTASPQQSLATHGHSLAPELIVADVDRGELRPCTAGATSFPTSVAALKDAAPPAAALAKRLAAVVGPEKFDEVEVQAACLRFVADVLNVHNGCLSDSQEAPRSAEIGRDRCLTPVCLSRSTRVTSSRCRSGTTCSPLRRRGRVGSGRTG